MNDEKLFPAPSTMHTANVFLPGSLGPVRREVMLAEDVQDLVDRLTHAIRERDQLATAIANAGIAAGIAHVNMAFDLPRLVEIAEIVGKPDKDGERYRWMRDCPWPGHMQAVGITALGDDANWLAGADADRAIDAAMAPLSDEIPDFSPGSGNKARRRAASLGLDMDAAMKTPLTDRQCHDADCWLCDGTGQLDNGEQCDLNGKKAV